VLDIGPANLGPPDLDGRQDEVEMIDDKNRAVFNQQRKAVSTCSQQNNEFIDYNINPKRRFQILALDTSSVQNLCDDIDANYPSKPLRTAQNAAAKATPADQIPFRRAPGMA